MKRAVISDIHSNLEAFEAVLADLDGQNIEEIYCLGDLVGYGPDPLACIDRMMGLGSRVKICLLGNHDQATIFDPEGFNSVAERAIYWTRAALEEAKGPRTQDRLMFLCELPRCHRDGKIMFVHGSPRNPLNEYVFFDDIYEEGKMEKLFSIVPQYCFQGHTHVPGVFTEDLHYHSCQELPDGFYELGTQKLMINVGSVGQPRDRDPRACYVVLDDDRIQFRRIEYNVDQTCKKIADIPELDNFLGDRLRLGK